jgi:bifunctional non-homologous end joining protein LigD
MPRPAAARFLEPMLLQRTDRLPDDPLRWQYELKLDGYRAIAFKRDGDIGLRSRNGNDFGPRYPAVLRGLKRLPDDTIVDGELVAFGDDGHPSFNALQNATSSKTVVMFYLFDVLVLEGRDLRAEPLHVRRELLERHIVPKLAEPAKYNEPLDASLDDLIRAVKAQGFEGLVAKRRDSRYESGERSGAWQKMRINRGQEFVIGGYTIGTATFDALVFGYYDGGKLMYAARTRNGFTPALRRQLFKKFKPLEIATCPFANLPEAKPGRWGQGLTKAKMAECQWLKPVLVGQFEFVEWTPDNHLRHSRFIALRDDKPARSVTRE